MAFDELEQRAVLMEAAITVAAADQAERHLRRARALDASFPSGAPSPLATDDELARQVATAVHDWQTRPKLPQLSGSTAAELRLELEAVVRVGVKPPPVTDDQHQSDERSGIIGFIVRAARALLARLFGRRRAARPAVKADELDAERERRRHTIERLIAAREREETVHADIARRRVEIEGLVGRAAGEAGVAGGTPEASIRGLRDWEAVRDETRAENEQTRGEWNQLQGLLDGRSLDDLAGEALEQRRRADQLAASCEPADFAEIKLTHPGDSELRDAQTGVSDARGTLEHARGEIEQFAANMSSVADAEDELAAAQSERERVEELERTLTATIDFLERAEERVHRDIAPMLTSTVREWLPRVTAGRYTDVRVDPETLTVEVSGARALWRRADLLSHGTAEQVYLLLRVAMAQHLTAEGEVCPLILDDVVTACDTGRREQVLDTLLALSEATQVILFSQEQEVLDWARRRLQEPRDRLIMLNASQVPA